MALLAYALRFLLLVGTFLTNTSGTPITATARLEKSAEILKYMNTSADPCEDFYQFTCGNYATYHPASFDQKTTGLLETIEYEFTRQVQLMLSTNDAADTIIDKKVKSFYESCLQRDEVPKDKLRKLIAEFGQMPALEGDKWREQDFDWMTTVAKIAYKYNINILITIGVDNDLANNQLNSFYMAGEETSMPKSVYLDEKYKLLVEGLGSMYADYLENVLDLETTLAKQTATEIVDLQKALARGRTESQEGIPINERVKQSTIDQAHERYSKDFNLKQLLNMTLGSLPELTIYVEQKYVENLIEVLRTTPKRTLANYIFYKLMTAFAKLPHPLRSLQDDCLADTNMYFFENLANMFYRKYATKEADQTINHMWLDIKAAFQKVLTSDRLSWISETTRQYGLKKLDAIKLNIKSYADYNVTQELGTLNLNDNDYVENLRAILSLRASQDRANDYTLPQPINDSAELSTMAKYDQMKNAIEIPVSLLQPLYFWAPSYPNAYNFGVLGALLSHELIHGFDGRGHTIDIQGRMQHEWWQENSTNGFKERTKCFIDQYHQFSYAGQQLAPMANQNENIADNGGVRLAYAAYLNWYENAGATKLESLDGLNYNHKQLFFISYGHLWCSDALSAFRSILLTSDAHVPEQFRANGPLSNMAEFSQEFNCPPDSAMNRANKCEIF